MPENIVSTMNPDQDTSILRSPPKHLHSLEFNLHLLVIFQPFELHDLDVAE